MAVGKPPRMPLRLNDCQHYAGWRRNAGGVTAFLLAPHLTGGTGRSSRCFCPFRSGAEGRGAGARRGAESRKRSTGRGRGINGPPLRESVGASGGHSLPTAQPYQEGSRGNLGFAGPKLIGRNRCQNCRAFTEWQGRGREKRRRHLGGGPRSLRLSARARRLGAQPESS